MKPIASLLTALRLSPVKAGLDKAQQHEYFFQSVTQIGHHALEHLFSLFGYVYLPEQVALASLTN